MLTPRLAPAPSPYQQAIYEWIRTGTGSACVIAVAGSGKTTTLVEAVRHIPPSQTVRFFAFNKLIADTLQARIRARNVTCSTFHSAGYRTLLQEFGARVETARAKTRTLLRELLTDTDYRAYGEEAIRLLSIGKGMGVGLSGMLANTPETWLELLDHHDLDFQWLIPPGVKSDAEYQQHLDRERQRVGIGMTHLLRASNDAAKVPYEWAIDFDDQLYLPLLWNLTLPQYDWVLVDEAQDTNPVQRAILHRSLKPGGRLLAVGDPHQAIYAWRGASHDALDLIRDAFQTIELPLSVCYRCARAIVDKARTVVPQIESAPQAPPGVVDAAAPTRLLSLLGPTDAILCRNNAPLVKLAYELIAQGVACKIQGKDIGEGLVTLLGKLHPTDLLDATQRLLEYQKRETARYEKSGQASKAQQVEDKVTCILTILDNLTEDEQSLEGLVGAIQRLFSDTQSQYLTLSTIHKAKGLEWPTVAIIRSDLIPSFWATKDWQKRQERNLLYVAWTRAKERLLIIDDKPEWLRKKEARERGEDETCLLSEGL